MVRIILWSSTAASPGFHLKTELYSLRAFFNSAGWSWERDGFMSKSSSVDSVNSLDSNSFTISSWFKQSSSYILWLKKHVLVVSLTLFRCISWACLHGKFEFSSSFVSWSHFCRVYLWQHKDLSIAWSVYCYWLVKVPVLGLRLRFCSPCFDDHNSICFEFETSQGCPLQCSLLIQVCPWGL